MNDELLNRRVLREITKAGKPITCAAISIALSEHPRAIRGALETLVSDNDVVYANGLYARAHGGYNPDPESAA